MSLVSIVVPIYNVQTYLPRCLESLLAQTLEDIEIILINDGSKDESLAVCEHYAKQDKRIKVIDQVNQGVSVARNTGLLHARGRYIGFVDPDDWIEPNMYEVMTAQIQAQACSICLCNYYKDDKNSSVPKTLKIKKDVLIQEEIVAHLVSNMVGADDIMPHYNFVMGCVWRGLYSKNFLTQHEICFEPGINIMEDLAFNVKALLNAEKICIVRDYLYHYIQNPTSILHTYKKNMWEDQMRVHELLEKYIQSAGLEEQMRNRLDMRYIGMAFSAIFNEVQGKNKEDMKNRVNKVKEICADEKLKLSLERIRPIRGSESPVKQEEPIKRRPKKVKTLSKKTAASRQKKAVTQDRRELKRKYPRLKRRR
ncbi:MAG: glycosyltransferase [Niameybacter sp.]